MARFLYHLFFWYNRKASYLFLAFFMISGFLSGIHLASQISFSNSLMRGVFASPMSIVLLLSAALIPFLFSAFAVYFSCRRMLYGIAFLKLMVFGFVAAGITAHYTNAGWLARPLTMFSSCISLPLLTAYWLHHIQDQRPFSLGYTLSTGMIITLAVYLDYRYIQPICAAI